MPALVVVEAAVLSLVGIECLVSSNNARTARLSHYTSKTYCAFCLLSWYRLSETSVGRPKLNWGLDGSRIKFRLGKNISTHCYTVPSETHDHALQLQVTLPHQVSRVCSPYQLIVV